MRAHPVMPLGWIRLTYNHMSGSMMIAIMFTSPQGAA